MRNWIYFFLLLLILLFTNNNINAQWVQTTGHGSGYEPVYSFAISEPNIYAGTSDGVYLTVNNGQNWIQTTFSYPATALAISGSNIYAGTSGISYGYGAYLSTNNGQNWTETGLYNQSVGSFVVNGSNIFSGTGHIYLSSNNGQTWSLIWPYNQIVLSVAVSGPFIFAGTYDYGVYSSTNLGQNWSQTTLSYQRIYSLATNGSYIFSGTSVGVFASTDNGQTWTQTALNNQTINSLNVIGSNVFAGSNGTGIYVSRDNGLTWVQKNEGMGNQIIHTIATSTDYVFVGTDASWVWKRLLSDIIALRNISSEIPEKSNLFQNYPNPFNPSTKIEFAIPKQSFTKLVVYDMIGRQITTLVNEQLVPGTYSVNFDGTNLASGVYFYRLEAGEFVDTKRMVILK